MSIEIREIKVIGYLNNSIGKSKGLDKEQVIKLFNDQNERLIDKCVNKVLKKIEKNNRR